MNFLYLTGLLALTYVASNQPANQSNNNPINQLTTRQINQPCAPINYIAKKSVWLYHEFKFCLCYNTIGNSDLPSDIDNPIEIFTTQASKYLNLANNNSNSGRTLTYKFDSKAKMRKYCNKFRDFGWECIEAENASNN